jgi:hypothetical protein
MDNQKYYNFLNSLRDTGVVNMFGAAPYLVSTFGVSRTEAREILFQWMQSFEENK